MIMRLILIFFLSISAAFAQQQSVLVAVEKVTDGTIAQSDSYVGTIVYASASRIAAEYAGRVNSAPFEEGDRVKKGSALLSVNADILVQNISAQNARLNQQNLLLEKAKRDLDRNTALRNEKVITEQKYQDSKTEYEIQRSSLKAMEAEQKVLLEQYKRAQVLAVYDAVVVKKHVTVGEWVNVGQSVYEIAEQRLEVIVNVPIQSAAKVSAGQRAEVLAAGAVYSALVKAVVPQADTVSRTFPVKLAIDYNPALFGGMDCKVNLASDNDLEVQFVPMDAVVRRGSSDVVFTVAEDKAKQISVIVVGYKGSSAAITGERIDYVITRGSESIQNGQSVRTN